MFIIQANEEALNLVELGEQTSSLLARIVSPDFELKACKPRLVETHENRDEYKIGQISGENAIDSILVDVLSGSLNDKLALFYPDVRHFIAELNLNPTHLLKMGLCGFMQNGTIIPDALGLEIMEPSYEKQESLDQVARDLKMAIPDIHRIAHSPCYSDGKGYERRFCYEVE